MKTKLTLSLFLLILFGFSAAHLVLPDGEISAAERRKLAQVPEFTGEMLWNGEYADSTEKYLLDQFPLRDSLRTIKALWQFDVYHMRDNNGIYLVRGTDGVNKSVCKLDRELLPAQVNATISNTNQVYETYLQGMRVYFALIPDKNFFAAKSNGYPSLDYERMDEMLEAGLEEGIDYRGLTPCSDLTLDNYYSTDIHWRQECLNGVVENLSLAMNFAAPDFSKFSKTEYGPFYGAYYGQSALPVSADTLVTLSDENTDAAVVTGVGFDGEKAVYDESDQKSLDLYDLYLSGAQAILTVTNPNGNTGKELIIFRDSFGSSLAPLLLDSYDKITLIDLRYVTTGILADYVEFHDQDVLFLYNTGLVNSGMLLR